MAIFFAWDLNNEDTSDNIKNRLVIRNVIFNDDNVIFLYKSLRGFNWVISVVVLFILLLIPCSLSSLIGKDFVYPNFFLPFISMVNLDI